MTAYSYGVVARRDQEHCASCRSKEAAEIEATTFQRFLVEPDGRPSRKSDA